MLRVYYSNRTEELLRTLVEQLAAVEPVEPGPLVVPNDSMGNFVRQGCARLGGVAAIGETLSLPEFLSRATETLDEAVLLDRLVSALFDDELLARPELEPVRDYIRAAGDGADATDRRRVRLAKKLARLFVRYQASRPELLDCWRAGLFLGVPEVGDVERWQRRLWLEVAEPLGAPSDPGQELPPVMRLFGFSHFSRWQAMVLGRLAESAEVLVYSCNPCQEIWEAVATPLSMEEIPRRYERRGSDLGPAEVFSLEDPFRLSNFGEMLPLRLWGRSGRESLRLLNALTGCELRSHMRAPDGTSLLHQLQRDIMMRKPERDSIAKGLDFGSDESVVFLECGSVRRELEVVAAEIWSLLSESAERGDERLRFDDIAVLLVPSQARRYQALLPSVFREAHEIPHCLVGLPLESDSRIAQAVLRLLDVPLAGVRGSSLRRFVTHPSVLAAFPGSSGGLWNRWLSRLGVDDESTAESHAHDWDRGLSRLALGAFAREAPQPIALGDLPGAGSFGALLRSLLADAREAARATMTIPAWAEFLTALVDTYVSPLSEEDGRDLERIRQTVSSLAESSISRRKVRYRVFHELLRSEIARLTRSPRLCRAGGVTVSPLLPMRSIPYRVIFVAGLGERQFPRRDTHDQLDLQRAHRRAGDMTARDEDRYAFLETLLSARERIYFSWVSKDPATGESLSPSSLVTELIETLAGGYVAGERLSVRHHPVHRADDPRACGVFSEAAREKSARALGEHLRRHLGASRPLSPSRLRASLPEAVLRALFEGPPPPPVASEAGAVVTLTLNTLREFLECPLQGSARYHLRLGGDDPWTRDSPPLVLTLTPRRIEVSRGLPLQAARAFLPQKESLKGFLDHVFSCASGLKAGEPSAFLAVDGAAPGEPRCVRFDFAPIEAERARAYLEALAHDLLSGIHEYLLPCEVVFGAIDSSKPERTSSAFGPIPHPEDYRIPSAAEREELVRRRFGLYFEALVPAGEKS